MRVVGRIVQHLNLQQCFRVLDFRHFIDQALDDVALVVNRQLDGHRRQLRKTYPRIFRGVLPVLEISTDDIVAMQAVDGENGKRSEIGDEQRPIEPIQLMDAGERLVVQAAHQPVGEAGCGKQGQRDRSW